jgi:hypothetical protein
VAPAVVVPTFPNSTCPVMGKPISTRLFTDTTYGRIYICCKGCIEEIQADVPFAYRTAYPRTEMLRNKRCPVTGAEIGAEAKRVLLQGVEFSVLDAPAAKKAVEDAQATLAKLRDPKLVDVGNRTCPILGTPVAPNVVAIHAGHLIRLASVEAFEELQKDPAQGLARARAIRAREDQAAAAEHERERAQRDGG